jgi:hypothetical protein
VNKDRIHPPSPGVNMESPSSLSNYAAAAKVIQRAFRTHVGRMVADQEAGAYSRSLHVRAQLEHIRDTFKLTGQVGLRGAQRKLKLSWT